MGKEASTGLIGFTSPLDFLYSFIEAKTWFINLIVGFCAALTTFISNYIWDSFVTMIKSKN
jgi:fluoride ion exporter CrcB/FEX